MVIWTLSSAFCSKMIDDSKCQHKLYKHSYIWSKCVIMFLLRCLQEVKTGYLPVSVVTSTSKRKRGWLYISQQEPTYVASGNEKKRPADCEFPTWSPSISYLSGSFNSGNENEIRIVPNTTHKNKLQIR